MSRALFGAWETVGNKRDLLPNALQCTAVSAEKQSTLLSHVFRYRSQRLKGQRKKCPYIFSIASMNLQGQSTLQGTMHLTYHSHLYANHACQLPAPHTAGFTHAFKRKGSANVPSHRSL